jgi:Tetratricopeptide repeat
LSHSKIIILLLISIALLQFPQPAFAGSPKGVFKIEVKLGKAFYSKANYKMAVKHFEKAISLKADSKLYFNIAQCYRLLKEYEKSLQYYNLFLPYIRNVKTVSKKRREVLETEVMALIVELTGLLEKQKSEAATKKVQMEKIAKEKARIESEKLRLQVEKLKNRKTPLGVKVAPEKTMHITPTRGVSVPGVSSRWWFWAGIGTVATGIILGTVSAFQAVSYRDKWTTDWNTKDEDNAYMYRTITDISFGVAIISSIALTVGILKFNGKPRENSPSSGVAFVPYCAPGSCGATLTFSF